MGVPVADAIAVIDHKSFPGADAKAGAANYPPLRAYAEALSAAEEPVSGLVVHLPILGLVTVAQTADMT